MHDGLQFHAFVYRATHLLFHGKGAVYQSAERCCLVWKHIEESCTTEDIQKTAAPQESHHSYTHWRDRIPCASARLTPRLRLSWAQSMTNQRWAVKLGANASSCQSLFRSRLGTRDMMREWEIESLNVEA